MLNFHLLVKAYQEMKAAEEKQKRYDDWMKQPLTYGMAQELCKTAAATGQKIVVRLADKSEVEFWPQEDPLLQRKRAYTEGF